MATFLDDLSIYNAKAAAAITLASSTGDSGKANLMSSLKSTANDTSLTEAVRLNALTALINVGDLLDIPLPPYFPITTTFANSQTYTGLHNDLIGLDVEPYLHLTTAEKTSFANKASLSDITFTNLLGDYTDNNDLSVAINAKQNALNGTGFVKANGGSITYDNSTYLTSISGIAATGALDGQYPNPTLRNTSVTGQLLTGFNVSAPTGNVTGANTILSAIETLNANVENVIATSGTISSISFSLPNSVFTFTPGPFTSGAASLSGTFNNQAQNSFFAAPASGGAGTPTFRAIEAGDLPVSGATANTYGSSSDIPQITVDAYGRVTAIANVTAASGGQVNTITYNVPSPVFTQTVLGTTNVAITLSLSQQIANTVWAGPISGANATPTFRALVAADIPNIAISQVTSLQDTLDGFLTDSLSDGKIWLGNISNAATPVTMSGDVTISNAGVTAIGAAKVQYSMIQNVTAGTFLGRYSATSGQVQQLSFFSGDFTLNTGTGVVTLASPVASLLTTKGDLLSFTTTQARVPSSNTNGDLLLVNNSAAPGINWATMSGDATIGATGALTIANSAVTLAKMANLANNRIIGNVSGSSAAPSALTGAQVTAILSQFSTSAQGLVPAASGVNDTTYFLRGDATWQPITGTGTVTAVSIATANGFTGTSSGGATPALTIQLNSLNGVLKGTGVGIDAAVAGTGGDYISPGQITQATGAGSGLTMASARLLGRTTNAVGVIETIEVNSSLSLASGTLSLNLGNGNIFTVQQQMPSIRLNGATSGFVSFTPPAVAGAQVYELPAAVPSGSGQYLTATTGGVLSWSSPAGSGTTTNAVTFNNGGSGDASGTTFNGSSARTISYNTIGAQLSNANLTGLSALSYASGTPLVRMTAAGTFSLDNGTYLAGTATQYSVLVGGAANSVAPIATSSPGKLLISNGAATNPGWTVASYLDTTTQYGILYSSAANLVSEILPPGTAGLFLQWTGSGYTWAAGGGGGGSGTVTNVSVVTNNGFSGSVANSTTTPAITLSTTITGLLKGSAGALVAATPGTDYLTSIGLTMPSAFTVTPGTLTANGTFAVTGAGTVAQYVRGDGSLANFPTAGGGGSSLNYYLNGSVTPSPDVVGYKQMSRVANTGAAANFTLTNTAAFQLMAEFVTDANDPGLLSIPAGSWNFSFYFRSSDNAADPQFYVDLLKYDGTNFTSIATGIASPETITNGTTIDLYNTSITIPSSTALTLTDRLVIKVYVDTDGNRTITFYTQATRLAEVFTTFTTGLTALNGLTAQVQSFANGSSGTAPAFVSSTATHTLNIPLANAGPSVTAGLISNTEYDIFNGKMSNPMTDEGDIIYGGVGGVPTPLPRGTDGKFLTLSGGVPAWGTIAAGGDVTGPASATDGNFAVFNLTTGKIIKESAAASLTAVGRATFNSGVDLGVSGTGTPGSGTTGTLIFRNGTTAATTTFQSSLSQSANLNYTWPITTPTAGQILSSDISGNLSWTNAGAGNVITSGTQTFTGTNTFNANTIRINNAANNGYHTLASLAGALGTLTATFPAATGTVPLLSLAQTFTALQTYSAGLTVSSGTTTIGGASTFSGAATFNGLTTSTNTVSISAAGSFTIPQLSVAGGTINWMTFGTGATGAPTLISSTRSAGTKVVIYQSSGANFDNAIGVETTGMWLSTTQGIRFYTNNSTTVRAAFDGDASNSNLTLTNATAVSLVAATATTANVFNTVATTVNIAGAATTLNIGGPATTLAIGNTATAAQTVNMFTASTASSTYNFATGATANGSTKTINIGTGGAAGSTTNITFGTSTTTNLRFFGSANTSGKPAVTGSRGGNAALASFLTALSNLGLIADSTTA
jgi:fibronectin-binding autotransporter adhesin